MRNRAALLIVLLLSLIMVPVMVTGCGEGEVARTETLTIYHAGSLSVPFDELEKEFEKTHPTVDVLRESGGSATMINKAITREEAGEAPPEIIASADYKLIPDRLYEPGYADWNIAFARNKMVLCYRDGAPHADEVASGDRTWYDVLRNEDVTWGHSNPDDDPCGYRTPMVIQLTQRYYYDEAATFGVSQDPDADGLYDVLMPGSEHERGRVSRGREVVRPKSVELIALLQSGDLDYAFEYSSVAVQHDLEFIELDDAINLSQTGEIGTMGITYEDFYKNASIEIIKTPGPPPEYSEKTGKPIVYGITITTNAPNEELAAEFIALLLSEEGRDVLEVKNGQPCIVPTVCDCPENLPTLIEELIY
ncbi:MAG: tungstate ABC transporter substrate-binding protein WtpA [Chloroflexota bacterium]|nr:tungstate ABC transporter substrate-binding protein WtpA [Chloroflexota bacterium]